MILHFVSVSDTPLAIPIPNTSVIVHLRRNGDDALVETDLNVNQYLQWCNSPEIVALRGFKVQDNLTGDEVGPHKLIVWVYQGKPENALMLVDLARPTSAASASLRS